MAIRNVTRAGVGLVVGIIILGVLVWGGLSIVRDRGEQARQAEAIKIADEQLKTESEKGVALNPDKDKDSNPKTESQNGISGSGSQGSTSTAQPGGSTSGSASNAAELPKTGPEAASIVALGLLTFATLSFVRSRQLLAGKL